MTNNTMIDISRTEEVVMRRGRRVRLLVLILSTVTLATLTALVALWGIGREVWVAKVLENGPQGLVGRLWYLGYAFVHTHLIVQALVLLTLVSLGLLVREFSRIIGDALTRPA